MDKIILKPCPVCGGYPQPIRVGDRKQYVVYRCEDCKETPVPYYEASITGYGAMKVWNRHVEKALRRGTDND